MAEVIESKRNSIEVDMRPFSYADTDPLSTKVFKVYPVVGEYCINPDTFEKWCNNTKQYIDQKLQNRTQRYKTWVYEQVTLVVIHYAKTWNSNEEGRFTKYVTMQLGYKDDGGKIWSILTEAIEQAFLSNHRLFIKRDGREFFETVMVHSFGPEESWYPVFDLLFGFYTNNLDWTYVPGDPLFRRVVFVLQRYFNNLSNEDDQYYIASEKYSLKVGIRRLVQERPMYCVALFESIVKRIQQLIRNESPESKRYSQSILDRWFAHKINSATPITEKVQSADKTSSELALDYSSISVKYCLSGNALVLRLPAIRLQGDTNGNAKATLYCGDSPVAEYDLTIRGNELGETIQQKTIVVPIECFTRDDIPIRLTVTRESSTIYDSEKKLYRTIILFSENTEVSLGRTRKEKYLVFAPDITRVAGNNIELSRWTNNVGELALHQNYTLAYGENTLALDTSDIKGIKIVQPAIHEHAHFTMENDDYLLVKTGASLKVYYEKPTDGRKYRIIVNGENQSLAEYFDSAAGNRSMIPLGKVEGTFSVSIVDVAAGTIIFRENYCYISGFEYRFNKKVYVTDADYNNIELTVSCGGNKEVLHYSQENEIQYYYQAGMITFDVPGIHYHFGNIVAIFSNRYIRAEDISEDSVLEIVNTSGIPCSLKIGRREIKDPSAVKLMHCLEFDEENGNSSDLVISVLGNQYTIGTIVRGNVFLTPPQFSFSENTLTWDGGRSFVGDVDASLVLTLSRGGNTTCSLGLTLHKAVVYRFGPSDFIDGVYDWDVLSNGNSIAHGSAFFGDKSRVRFDGKTIEIDRVTEDIDANSLPVRIKRVYIDQIKYSGKELVKSEGGIFDVYTGCMYWVTTNGDKRYYSFKYVDGKISKYKVNPVKIIYINDKYLRIVNEDEDGIYYYYNAYSNTPGNEITDIEPTRNSKGYHDVLFYLYRLNDVYTGSLKTTVPVVVPPPVNVAIKSALPLDPTAYSLLKDLRDASQTEVITAAASRRILVNAGPGTGKTWTLIERIIYLVQNGADPESIQVLCFSRAAVEVVRDRMLAAIQSGRVSVDVNKVDIRTFDSFATQLLYWVKDSDYTEIGKTYSIEKLNYEDRIGLFNKVLSSQPGLVGQCEHLIVDEVQDLVLSRAEMVLNLIKAIPDEAGVTLFGDACQAIYDYQVDEGITSVDFYCSIRALNQFDFCSFSHNYRQATHLQDYCTNYRLAILDNDIKQCNNQLAIIGEDLPEYSTPELTRFEEDSLNQLLASGNVGILTRSNAQTLVISKLLHKKNIKHIVQRRLVDNLLAGWIAVMFNDDTVSVYDRNSFAAAVVRSSNQSIDLSTAVDIWSDLSSDGFDEDGIMTSKDLLCAIQNYGKHGGLFAQEKESSVYISTIHRSKGREFDSVLLLDSLITDNTEESEEHRVNYVALSRARERMYRVSLPDVYFRKLESGRCYSTSRSFHSGSLTMRNMEVGLLEDLDAISFCMDDTVQRYLRQNAQTLGGKEIMLEKDENSENSYPSYRVILRENGLFLGYTSQYFAEELTSIIREIKKLPWHASIYNHLYPSRFTGLHVRDVISHIGMIRGNEHGVNAFEGMEAWNSVAIEGYASAEYR